MFTVTRGCARIPARVGEALDWLRRGKAGKLIRGAITSPACL